jgi:purine-binding chemotaxis protein CheW
MTEHAREVLILELQSEIFAIDAHRVREILDVVPITEVPGSRPFVSGLINVRGKIVPLADLRLKFGMPTPPPTIDTRIVVIETEVDGETTAVGLIADRVREVTELVADSIEPTPRLGMRLRSEYIEGIGKRGSDLIIVVDLQQILASTPEATPRGNASPGNDPALRLGA